jgi:protein tyrosine/serine phosphatase
VSVHVPNLRDVGGMSTADGRRVREGLLLRSALPAADDLVPEDFAWPPTLVIDLRSPLELAEGHPLDGLGSRVVNLPLLDALEPGERHRHDGTLAGLYRQVNDFAAHLLVELVSEIASADGPVLVHCAAGKDRTGIGVALVLRLLGVGRDEVIADYLLTDQARDAIDRRLNRRYDDSVVPAAFYLVVPEALAEVMDMWDAHPGGVEGWFLASGGDPEVIERLRARFLIG